MRVTAEEHVSWILERVTALPEMDVAIGDAHGYTLAEPVLARHPLPLWDNSAMDGYAVRAADVSGASADSPAVLRVTGEVPAGSTADPGIAPGESVRIMTGAPVPSDADAVIPVELTLGDREDSAWAKELVRVIRAAPVGANIRRAAEDTAAGSVLAEAGTRLGAARLAALAAAGVARVRVRRAPRVAVIATGSELRAPGAPLARGQIPESNSLLISGLLRELGIDAVEVRHSADEAVPLAAELSTLAERCDVIITTGGVGPGTHDVVRIALEREPEVRALRVAVRPGQPQCAGRLAGGAFIFALPGNPVSAAVSFELFVRPALLAMQGRAELGRVVHQASAETDWRGTEDRLQVLPVIVRSSADAGLVCVPAVNPRGVSHAVGGHGASNGYAMIGIGRGDVTAGETVPVVLVTP
ncbi:molybdopterin molybdotransferase MoeA [Leucobacter insecticola]|uniref:Molybdopterin molybdenumtransferase n=1 Tax=Leucobacter insecticola TaxID=2714934 RepID=A0A6G8FKK8_9MICO|nr:gephyrin-like molybdotransferase Glp [Leucobacter insecticola]QIM16976.1 molybdopterin molybdotransferase MoeA [Leucobacter insecticola]